MEPFSRSLPSSILACALFLGASCSEAGPSGPASVPEPAPPPAPRTPWKPPAPVNVVFIVVDTLRADALLDEAGRYDTPNLDRLGRESVVFPRTFSAAPMTLPSHMSLFSSRPPFETKVLNNGQKVPQELPLVADWLGRNGYHTRAVISLGTLNPINPRLVESAPSRGFASYDIDYYDIASAEATNRRLVTSLDQRDPAAPLFLFAHFADPHEPYDAHGTALSTMDVFMNGALLDTVVTSDMNQWSREVVIPGGRTVFEFQVNEETTRQHFVRRFECQVGGRALPLEWELGKPMERLSKARVAIERGADPETNATLRFWANDLPESNVELHRRYGLEVAYVDRQIGELLAELERRELYRDSLIVFTSDHGEGLGDHKLVGHVERLTDELIHVPLMIKLPANDPRRAELERAAKGLVTHLDIVPTLLEVIGLPPLPGQRGTSLFEPHTSVHIAETHRPEARRTQVALRDEHFKMVFFPADPGTTPPQPERFELYDLLADPNELANVFAKRSGERPDWPERLRLLHEHSAGGFDGGTDESEEERRAREDMLKALGYGGESDASE